jgi:hypothetical protein
MDKGAYLNSQIACAMIEAMGMQAANDQKKYIGESMAYYESDFTSLLSKYGLYHNSVITFLQE